MRKDKRLGTPVGRAALLRARNKAMLNIMCGGVERKRQKDLVEAVGVEPTSENVTGQEPTYLVSVHATGITPPHSPLALRTDKKRKQLARDLVPAPWLSVWNQPTVRRPSAARRRSRGGRLLS